MGFVVAGNDVLVLASEAMESLMAEVNTDVPILASEVAKALVLTPVDEGCS
jgi:hypothetical protein